jgi:hypothetical protein
MSKINYSNTIFKTQLLGLFKDSNGDYYFDDYSIALNKNVFGSFYISDLNKTDIKILVIDDELKEICKSYDYVKRKPSEENIKAICLANLYDNVFMLYYDESTNSLITKTLKMV